VACRALRRGFGAVASNHSRVLALMIRGREYALQGATSWAGSGRPRPPVDPVLDQLDGGVIGGRARLRLGVPAAAASTTTSRTLANGRSAGRCPPRASSSRRGRRTPARQTESPTRARDLASTRGRSGPSPRISPRTPHGAWRARWRTRGITATFLSRICPGEDHERSLRRSASGRGASVPRRAPEVLTASAAHPFVGRCRR